jgi:hypothetical protein
MQRRALGTQPHKIPGNEHFDTPDTLALQASLLLVVSVFYMVYLRLVVPYSRLVEMSIEYWVALLDTIVFSLALVSGQSWLAMRRRPFFCVCGGGGVGRWGGMHVAWVPPD